MEQRRGLDGKRERRRQHKGSSQQRRDAESAERRPSYELFFFPGWSARGGVSRRDSQMKKRESRKQIRRVRWRCGNESWPKERLLAATYSVEGPTVEVGKRKDAGIRLEPQSEKAARTRRETNELLAWCIGSRAILLKERQDVGQI